MEHTIKVTARALFSGRLVRHFLGAAQARGPHEKQAPDKLPQAFLVRRPFRVKHPETNAS